MSAAAPHIGDDHAAPHIGDDHAAPVLATFIEILPESEVRHHFSSAPFSTRSFCATGSWLTLIYPLFPLQYLFTGDPAWLRALLRAYNACFAFGHSLMLLLLAVFTILAAFPLGKDRLHFILNVKLLLCCGERLRCPMSLQPAAIHVRRHFAVDG
jgi:hypothetical protein